MDDLPACPHAMWEGVHVEVEESMSWIRAVDRLGPSELRTPGLSEDRNGGLGHPSYMFMPPKELRFPAVKSST
jgi:hypothetical protein